jgi:Tol biopolymer transport system component
VVVDEWNNWSPIWSPDGQEIAFLSSRGNKRGIWRIPAFGGTPTLVAYIDQPATDLKLWSKGGTKLYFRTDDNLFSVDLATKAVAQITNFDSTSLIVRFFSVSPGEDQIAFVDLVGGQHDLWTMPLTGGNATRITDDPEEDRFPIWHPDGKRLIYSSQRDGIFQLCVAYLDGRRPLKLTTGDSDSFASDVSADGTKVLYSSSREESDIWAINVGTGEEQQVTSDVSAELWSDFSRDGGRIAFQSVRQLGQSGNLYKSLLLVRPVDTDRGQVRLASEAQQPRWSPDNQRIAFLRATDFGVTIWAVSAVGGEEQQLTRRSVSGFSNFTLPYNRFTTRDFDWSPDSKRVCYCSEEPEPGLWVCDAEGQSDVKVTGETNAGSRLSSPTWSPDGARIAYVANTNGENAAWSVCVSDLKKAETKTLYQTNSVMRLLDWSPDGALFIATIEGRPNVWPSPAQVKIVRLSVEQGTVEPVGLADIAYLYTTELSPDGQLVAFASRQEGKGNICVLSTSDGKTRKITTNNDPRLFFSALSWSPDSKRIVFDKQSRYSLLHMISNFR